MHPKVVQTRNQGGERVSKEVFPSLIAQLWDASFKPDHCKGGFCGAGLAPFFMKACIPEGCSIKQHGGQWRFQQSEVH